ncbi:MAG: hypothetical protein KBC58_10990 [Flavobacterium sp.]|nr:hypothetical protein [Flavobacterium sp.]
MENKENYYNKLRLLLLILIGLIVTFFSISRRKNLKENHVIVIGVAIKNTYGTGNDGVEYKFDYQGKTYQDWCFTDNSSIEGEKYFVLCNTENTDRSILLEKCPVPDTIEKAPLNGWQKIPVKAYQKNVDGYFETFVSD